MIAAQGYALLIPTFNRPEMLNTLLGYLAAKKASFPVFVLDSSNDEYKLQNKIIVDRCGLNVQLMPFDTSARFDFKIGSALKEIDDDYVSLCADDDLVFVDALETCIREISVDDSLVACHGVYLNFLINHQNIDLGVEYASPSIDADSAIERACQLLTKYEALNYAVFRRDVMAEIMDAASQVPQNSFWELFSNLVPLLKGKVRRLNKVYYVRRAHGASWGHPAALIAADPDLFMKAFLEYRESLFEYCESEVLDFGAEDRKTLTQAHMIYLCQALQNGSAIRWALAGTSSPLGRVSAFPESKAIMKSKSWSLILPLLSLGISFADRLHRRRNGTDIMSFKGPGKNALTIRALRSVKALLSDDMIIDLSRFGEAIRDGTSVSSAWRW